MTTKQTFVIVGASLAGAKAAQTLREEGFEGRVVLVGAETERPYERPPLSKGYLVGKEERDKIYVHDAGWYAENAVELLLGRRVTGIDRAGRQVELDDGRRLGYDRLLLAPGSSPRPLDVPGADLDGVHYLRTVGDSERLREAIRGGGRVVVAGAGWIGMETAAAARSYGCEVTVVGSQPAPLQSSLGPEMGAFFAEVHRGRGADVRLGRKVTGIAGDGRVRAVTTDDGVEIPADVVIVGAGVRPNTELAEQAGLAVDNGIVVDASLRTGDPDIYAAGDVANAFNPLYGTRIRVEHWANALNGGQAAARAMLGQEVVYDRPPYFFTDQYDVGMEFSGWFAPGGYDSVVTRGDLEAQAFYAFWLAGGRVVAGMHVNQWDDGIGPVQDLIRGGGRVDPARLADPSVPLADLAKG
ncbi:3-phenylpropionate/trans-cinnamate dioxygenase ferredoxin reductase subunit [Streptosporangium album]|uniref:3-phenylpropionate/trans-cinnamate dioxygenase ferredoxin reductase subunit n=1 Tax=Streptosporangium album TaxID=47479 RepID=A0A7W7WAG4_9ACTN|nr:FAD-dependent oxidoreductase [Streptosporangium album]MBB4940407.1 3-phenylpropionate/trans-cinnamate dioxygenase ferredoxin reductase subunit [Streptosporangium album]